MVHICDLCGETFSNRVSLSAHYVKVHETKQYSCDKCNKPFSGLASLRRHIRVLHTGTISQACEKCKEELTMCTHEIQNIPIIGEKLLRCEECQETFTRKVKLRQHVRLVHTQQKQYTCDVCHKIFYALNHLNQHKITHDRDRSVVSNLEEEDSTWDEIMPIVCSKCNIQFSQLDYLTQHLLLHDD